MPDLPEGAWNAQWISISIDPREDLGVFGFRRRFELASIPQELKVRVSADQRYKLYVNGQFVGFGPQRGDVLHWFYETYDLAPFLKKGENWIAALVWNFGRWAPMAQHTARQGFVLESLHPLAPSSFSPGGKNEEGGRLSTPDGWEVARLSNWSFDMMHSEDMNFYIDIGPGEIMDFRGAPWGWRTGEDAKGLADWRKPNNVCRAEERGTMGGMTPWSLVPRSIPFMLYEVRAKPPVFRRRFKGDSSKSDVSDKSDLSDNFSLELGRKYLFDYEELLTAYPRIAISGPAGTVVVLSYAEGMWQEKGGKGNRNEVAGKKMSGYQDKIVLDGQTRTIEPLWWRTYRYLMVETYAPSLEGGGKGVGGRQLPARRPSTPQPPPSKEGEQVVVLNRLDAIETGYPLKEESRFDADDKWVKPIWDVSVRTAKRCAGETYFDCPYYEQLQYVGDTRIQALIGYYLGRDRSLTRNAVETLGWSLMENGLTQSRYPSRQPQIIPPFSLWWVMMLYDQALYDVPPNDQLLDHADEILKSFAQKRNEEQFWNFVDWVPNWAWGVPPKETGLLFRQRALAQFCSPGTLLEVHSTGEKQAKSLEKAGEEFARDFQRATEKFLKKSGTTAQPKKLEDFDFVAARKPGDIPTEHAEALYRVAQMALGIEPFPWPTEALSKANAAKCTYYFSYYKHLAMFGREDAPFDYMTELAPWKEMIENGLSTFAENPEPVRSDCHAWSAHPILGFFQIVAGVTSIAPGWKKARIDPRPGSLKRFDAHIAHPDGNLQVKFEGGKLEIDSPVPFELRWKGKKQELKAGAHKIG